ncbi:DNA adenine methylase [Lacticaseibacillus paracasei]|uniref:DNA adenine methylase n=1 Tax=Lacticaseibacillus paracasei TaxID=1597 RepID=UPI00235EFE7E|nr:DNA adenine methylase [Lacticaseibacillus paracasei]
MKQSEKWKRGLPYVGNKGQKAEKIIDILPAGNRLVDVFGGGGSISLTASSSGKWNEVVYNDRRETVVNLLKALIEDNPHFDLTKYVYMDRETFYNWRDNMPDSIERTLVLTVWSFSNNLHDYLWGKKIEKEKLQLTRAIFWGDTETKLDGLYSYAKNETSIAGKYRMFHKWRLEKMNIRSRYDVLQQFQRIQQLQQLQRIQQLQQLQQLERLQQLEKLQHLEFLTLDYRSLKIGPEDVVYCDPPYIGTGKNYGGFDNESFQRWLANCPAKQIYISEYTQLPHTEVAFILGKKQSFQAKGKRPNELLLKYVK